MREEAHGPRGRKAVPRVWHLGLRRAAGKSNALDDGHWTPSRGGWPLFLGKPFPFLSLNFLCSEMKALDSLPKVSSRWKISTILLVFSLEYQCRLVAWNTQSDQSVVPLEMRRRLSSTLWGPQGHRMKEFVVGTRQVLCLLCVMSSTITRKQ